MAMGEREPNFVLDDVRAEGALRLIAERDRLRAEHAALTAAAQRVCSCRYSARDAEIANLSDLLNRQHSPRAPHSHTRQRRDDVTPTKGKTMKKKNSNGHRAVLVTTERRGVFVGRLESYDEASRVAVLTDARMVIYWGTTDGLFQLVATGPTAKSKISAKAPRVRLEVCECVVDLAPEAEAAWNARG